MKTIAELRGYERRNGELHLFAVYEDGTYQELDPAEVCTMLNKWLTDNAQMKIGALRPPAKKTA